MRAVILGAGTACLLNGLLCQALWGFFWVAAGWTAWSLCFAGALIQLARHTKV